MPLTLLIFCRKLLYPDGTEFIRPTPIFMIQTAKWSRHRLTIYLFPSQIGLPHASNRVSGLGNFGSNSRRFAFSLSSRRLRYSPEKYKRISQKSHNTLIRQRSRVPFSAGLWKDVSSVQSRTNCCRERGTRSSSRSVLLS